MGKGAAAEMRRKKKGRPSLLDLQKRNLKQEEQHQQQQNIFSSNPNFNSLSRRSTRRNPNFNGASTVSDWTSIEGGNDDDDDDDDERKEKKVKLVVRLPPVNNHFTQPRPSASSLSLNSASHGSDSNADGDNHEAYTNKPKINATGYRSGDLAAADQLEKVQKGTDTLQGSSLDSGPTTPLPDKKLLVFILDRLQKKDTYGVFSEPVDADELPDYNEVIEHPMDFQTLRNKLNQDRYSTLEEFEADIFLICSNAMQYNAPDTVYFRQARSIHELAKRDFENLRQVNDNGEPQPKIVRRGRPPSKTKNLKSSFGSPPFERFGPECSSDATLASGGDGSNSHNLRKGPMVSRFQSNDSLFRASHQSRNNETSVELVSEWNTEFPASILKAEAKNGKKQFSLDENRRATYKQFRRLAFGHEPSVLTTFNGDLKQLMGVGLHSEHGYARSLARFASNLGPIAWKIASKKIKSVLPTGVEFGPGWVGETEGSLRPPSASPEQKSSTNSLHDGNPLGHVTIPVSGINSVVTYGSALPCKEDVVEVVRGQSSTSELAVLKSGSGGAGPSFQSQQKHVLLNPDRNGFIGVSGNDFSSQMGRVQARVSIPSAQSGLEEASVPPQMLRTMSAPMAANHLFSEPKMSGGSRNAHCENILSPGSTTEVAFSGAQPWQALTSNHRQYSLPAPPDLNVRFQGSPNSNLRIGSPQQPDLALQL
ncbi:hypothetical protein U1Q18_015988 [Sarracenia purpurea var. burkii]